MSKQKPAYYQTKGGLYVALNRAAVKMFKKKKMKYINPKKTISLEDVVKMKKNYKKIL